MAAKVQSISKPQAGDKYLGVPGEFKKRDQWITYSNAGTTPKPKRPRSADGVPINGLDSHKWVSFAQACRALERGAADNIGFVISADDPFLCVDLDHCFDETGRINPEVDALIHAYPSYIERSTSGCGLHIWYLVEKSAASRNENRGGIEVYDRGKPMMMTGNVLPGNFVDGVHNFDTLRTINESQWQEIRNALGELRRSQSASDGAGGRVGFRENDPSREAFELIRVVRREHPEFTIADAGKIEAEIKQRRPEMYKRQCEKHDESHRNDGGWWMYSIHNNFKKERTPKPPWKPKANVIEMPAPVPASSRPAKAIRKVDSATPTPKPKTKLVLEPLSAVAIKPIEWLWQDRIPARKLTIFSGDPDVGKTTVVCDLVARFTTGRDFPDGAPAAAAGRVLILTAEDDISDTLKPRLLAAGADENKITNLRGVSIPLGASREEREFALDSDLHLLETTLIENPTVKLIVVDPITSYLGTKDLNKEQQVRAVLVPLGRLCEKTGVTVIGLGHFSKRSDVSALHKVGGAVALTGVARATWLFAKSPDCEDEFQMLRGKCNVGKRKHGLRYTFGEATVPGAGTVPVIQWGKEVTGTADSILTMDPADRKEARAERLLKEMLANGKAVASTKIFEAAKEAGLGEKTVYRVKKGLGVKAVQTREGWTWVIPTHPDGHAE